MNLRIIVILYLPEIYYRVFTISDNRQYAGFFSKDYGDNIYNLTIETYTESDFYAPSEMSLPSVSISDIQNKASELRYQIVALD